jgi:hypothetical protein
MPSTPRQLLCFWTAAAALVTACGDSGLTAVDASGTRIPLRLVDAVALPNPTTPATIETATIRGDTLRLRVSYAGGCGGHEFGLAGQRALLESTPPQVIVVLRHEGHGDPCRAGLRADVDVDLRPLQSLVSDGHSIRMRLYEPQTDIPIDALLEYTF